MKHLLLLLVPLLLFSLQTKQNSTTAPIEKKSDDSFLLEVEYGKMLYKNPRGISCAKCHGKTGKGGAKIAKYYDDDRNPKILKGLNILEFTLEELTASLKNQYRDKSHRRVKHKIMPMYYLTDKEARAIYSYLQYVKKGK